jgi:ATP-dependent Lhr-like helicase
LKADASYPYLSERCRERLTDIQYIARNSGILDNLVTPLSDRKYAVFPWVGTRQLTTLHYALLHKGIKSKRPWTTCVYLEVIFSGTKEELANIIGGILRSDLNLYDLPLPDKIQVNGKYNEFVPLDLLRKQFIEDYLDFEGLKSQICCDS